MTYVTQKFSILFFFCQEKFSIQLIDKWEMLKYCHGHLLAYDAW